MVADLRKRSLRSRAAWDATEAPSSGNIVPLPGQVQPTAAITCGAHIDDARGVVEHLQIQRADWCIALFCGSACLLPRSTAPDDATGTGVSLLEEVPGLVTIQPRQGQEVQEGDKGAYWPEDGQESVEWG
jgi:hypothetical protein